MPRAVERANEYAGEDLLATAIAGALNDGTAAGWQVAVIDSRDCMRLSPVRIACDYWLRAYSDPGMTHRMWQRDSMVEVVRHPNGYIGAHEFWRSRARWPMSRTWSKPRPAGTAG